MLFVVRADDTVGTQQRLAVDAQPDHREVTVAEAKRRITGQREGKKIVGPVMDGEDSFFVECAHGEG